MTKFEAVERSREKWTSVIDALTVLNIAVHERCAFCSYYGKCDGDDVTGPCPLKTEDDKKKNCEDYFAITDMLEVMETRARRILHVIEEEE